MTTQTQSWRNMRFADFVDTNPKSALKKGNKYPFIPMELVDGVSKYPTSFFTKEFTGGGSRFSNGDTVFARITPCLENGKIAQIKDLPEGVGFGSTEFFVFRSKEGISDKDFVYYLSRTDEVRSPAIKSMVGASGRQRANKSVVENLEILVPSITEQRHISAVLEAYDNLIANNTLRIKILRQVAQAIYTEWFVNFRFPNHEKIKMVDHAEFGKIPERWSVNSLDKIMDFQGGSQPPKSEWKEEPSDGYIRMIQIRDYENDKHISFVKDSKRLKRCDTKDIMIARYGASVARICWGLEGAYNVALVKVIPNKLSYREFLRQFLSAAPFQGLLIGMSGRTAQAGFNKDTFAGIKLVVPPEELLEKFEDIISKNIMLQLSLTSRNVILTEMRDRLLPKLVTGEIKV